MTAMIAGKDGEARNYMVLPSAAWQSAQAHPIAIPDDLRTKLFAVYAEVERINALARFLLSPHAVRQPGAMFNPDASAMGLSRHTSADFLAREVGGAISLLDGLPDAG